MIEAKLKAAETKQSLAAVQSSSQSAEEKGVHVFCHPCLAVIGCVYMGVSDKSQDSCVYQTSVLKRSMSHH